MPALADKRNQFRINSLEAKVGLTRRLNVTHSGHLCLAFGGFSFLALYDGVNLLRDNMATSRKKVLVRTLAHVVHPGYLPLSHLRQEATSSLALLDLDARINPIPWATIRWIAYVRDFNLADSTDPEKLTRRTFLARPRTEGLWLRLSLTGGDALEGLAPLDLSFVDNLLTDGGLYLVPPDIRSNTQRLFLPRHAFTDLQLLAVITTPSKSKPAPTTGAPENPQPSLFPVR